MKINWKVRFKNWVFIGQLAAAILMPILAYMGLSWSDVTSWYFLGNLLWEAIKNPVIVVSILVNVLNTITDPTTRGISDSNRALSYDEPSV